MEGCAGEGPGPTVGLGLGWGKGIMLVCAFGVEDRVLVGGKVRRPRQYMRQWKPDVRARRGCE